MFIRARKPSPGGLDVSGMTVTTGHFVFNTDTRRWNLYLNL